MAAPDRQWDTAEKRLSRAAEIARSYHNRRVASQVRLRPAEMYDSRDLTGRALYSRGEIHRRMGDPARAATLITEAVEVFDRLGSPVWLARAGEALGRLHAAAGDPEAAAAAWQAALRAVGTAEAGSERRWRNGSRRCSAGPESGTSAPGRLVEAVAAVHRSPSPGGRI